MIDYTYNDTENMNSLHGVNFFNCSSDTAHVTNPSLINYKTNKDMDQ